jgi:carbon-monoxide dehydrogenase medium subunit
VLDARVELSSAAGVRHVPIREFFTGFQETAVGRGELVTALDVPTQPRGGAAFSKLSSLAANDWPVASAAVLVTAADDVTREIRIGLGALAPTPVYVAVTVAATGSDDDAVDAALAAVEPLIDPLPDVRGGVGHKRRLGRVAVADAVRAAWTDTPRDIPREPREEASDDHRLPFRRLRRRR